MRKLRSSRSQKVARAYALGLLRPHGAVVAGADCQSAGIPNDDGVGRVHPVYAWRDLAGFVHLVCATRDGPAVMSLQEADAKSILRGEPFTSFQLSPDPFALAGDIALMHRRGLVPDSWGIVEEGEVE